MLIKKYFLILGFFFISAIAALYGVDPGWFARTFFGIAQLDINFAHVLRAVMCLYVGFGLFWFRAAFVPERRNVALLTMIVFASGLLIGRLLSFLADGKPSLLLQSYAVIEFLLIPIAYWIYRLPEK